MFGGRRLVAKFALGPKKTSFRLEFEFQSDECASCWMFRSLDAPRWAMYADSSDKPWGQQELDHAVWGKPTDAAIERFLRDAGIEDVVVEEAKEAKDAATRRRWTYAKVLCLARRALMEKHGEGGWAEGAENGVYLQRHGRPRGRDLIHVRVQTRVRGVRLRERRGRRGR